MSLVYVNVIGHIAEMRKKGGLQEVGVSRLGRCPLVRSRSKEESRLDEFRDFAAFFDSNPVDLLLVT